VATAKPRSIRTLGLTTVMRTSSAMRAALSPMAALAANIAYLLKTHEIIVIKHADCGLMHTSEQDLRTLIQDRTGTAAIAPTFFFAF
jgi:carbonic anhydrase